VTKRVLVIDDDPDIRRIIQVSLEKFAQWQTVLASSGLEGIQMSRKLLPDAILLDISMPCMDGFECFSLLQADCVTRSIPVVLLTAKVLPEDQQRFAEMKIAGVITKPFNPITIWSQVAAVLNW
jgi:CheY-like chemotaxis protein